MVRYLLIIGALLVIAGPLRRPVLSAWRPLLSLIIGGLIARIIVLQLMAGSPRWMATIGPLIGAFVIGGAIRELLGDVLPPRKDKDA